MLIEALALATTTAVFGYWRKGRDKTSDKLRKLFMVCGVQMDDKYPVYKGRSDSTYLFKLPMGVSYDDFLAKVEYPVKDIFYPRPVVFSFNGLVLITVGDPLPRKVVIPEVNETKGFKIPLGKGILGEVYHDFDKIPHFGISGITRYGKTVALEMMIYSLLRQEPERVKFALFDLKGGLSFNKFVPLRQTVSMAKDVEESNKLLLEIEKEVNKRQGLFLERGYEKIQQAPWLERIFVIVDEAAQLSSDGRKGDEAKAYKACEKSLERIAQVGAGLGIHLIYCTQYPTSKTLPSQVKQNIDAILSFKLRNNTADRVVFDDDNKASKLPLYPGRAIYRSDKETELQVYYVASEKLKKMIEQHKKGEYKLESLNIERNETGEDTAESKRLDLFDSETTSEGS